MRWPWLATVVLAGGCATLTSGGAAVSVYRAPLDAKSSAALMPAGCRLLSEKAPVSLTELEMEGDKHPYRVQQNEAAAAGANVLLVRSRTIVDRRDYECAGASPITDCPPSSGAWYRVVFVSYACSADAIRSLQGQR